LSARTCDCRRFQDSDIPCAHVCQVIRHLGGAPKDSVGVFYLQERWIDTYSVNLKPLDTEGIIRLKRDYDKAVAEAEQQRFALPRTPLGPFAEAPQVQRHPLVPEMEVTCIEPPHTVVPRGHPTKKRKRKGVLRGGMHGSSPDSRAKLCCSMCKKPGHYAPKCTQRHT